MNIPSSVVTCDDVFCDDENHRVDIDNFLAALMNSVDIAANSSLPMSAPVSCSTIKGRRPPDGMKW